MWVEVNKKKKNSEGWTQRAGSPVIVRMRGSAKGRSGSRDLCTKKIMEGGGQAKMPKDDERRDAATVWDLEGGVKENQRHRR